MPLSRVLSSAARVLYLATALSLTASVAVAEVPRKITPVLEFELQSVPTATDVAWRSEQSIALAAAGAGVVEVDLVTREERLIIGRSDRRAQYGEGPTQTIWGAYRLATEGDLLVVTAPVGAFVWGRKDGQWRETHFADARDFDLVDGKAFIVGVQGERARWYTAPATFWSVRIGMDGIQVAPLKGGPNPQQLLHCTMTLNAAVARMPNGTVAVASGFSAGVTLYDRQGNAIRTWDTSRLGYHDRCDVSQEQGFHMGQDVKARFEWLNQRETLDDMIGTTHGPLLIIRKPTPDGTAWRGILLPFKGKPRSVSIPMTSSSPFASTRASARGTKVAFAIHDFPRQRPVTLKTRIVIAQLSK